ncbi:MAG TPA: hypothetical protein VH643_21360 [Gemmataceae bacterium]|jgi:hypothetical protein
MNPSDFVEVADAVISVLEKSIEHLKTAKSVVASEPATAEFHFHAALRELENVLHAAKTGMRR